MDPEAALAKLEKAGMGERALLGGARGIHLHSMIISCGWQRRERGCSYDWNGLKRGKAEFALIQYTLRGWGLLDFEGVRRKATPGTAMLLHFPHRNRYWLPPESELWEFVYLCLNGRELVRVWRELTASAGPLLKLEKEQTSLLCELYAKALSGKLESPFDNSAAAYALAMSLSKASLPCALAQAQRPETVKRALRLCEERLQDSALDVAALAAAAGLSRRYFSSVFEKAMGETPAACLKEMRLKEAARLLQTSRLSIKEVAAACGFGDFSYFCRAFRESFEATPGDFRRSGILDAR